MTHLPGKILFSYDYKDKECLIYQFLFSGPVFYNPLKKFVCIIGFSVINTDIYLPELIRGLKILHSF